MTGSETSGGETEADGYDAVVFDLDGTLVDLAVDWATVTEDVAALLADRGVETDGQDLWGLWDTGKETGHREAVNTVIATYEEAGARASTRLPAADHVPAGPVGVCTLNAESAARVALDTHDLARYVDGDAVVGRDSVATQKPDPEPLLRTLRALEVDPDRAVFVGDGERDERTAGRAGVAFAYVSEWLSSASAAGSAPLSDSSFESR